MLQFHGRKSTANVSEGKIKREPITGKEIPKERARDS